MACRQTQRVEEACRLGRLPAILDSDQGLRGDPDEHLILCLVKIKFYRVNANPFPISLGQMLD